MKFIPWCLLVAATSAGSAYAGNVGGAHGGGGNLRPLHAVPQAQIVPMIEREKWEVALFFNQMEIDWKRDNRGACPNDLCRKLFDGKRTIFDALADLKVDYPPDSKCRNPRTGEEEDGAAYPDTNSICLSPFSIAPQVDTLTSRVQALALYAHEASHLVGSTDLDDADNDTANFPDGEANFLQDEAIEAFFSRRSEELVARVKDATDRVASALMYFANLAKMSDAALWKAATATRADATNLFFGDGIGALVEDGFAPLYPERDRVCSGGPGFEDELPLPILRWTDTGRVDEGMLVGAMLRGWPNSDGTHEKYGPIFGANTSVSYPAFRKGYMPADAPAAQTHGLVFPNTRIYNVVDVTKLRADLEVVNHVYRGLQARLASYHAPSPSDQ